MEYPHPPEYPVQMQARDEKHPEMLKLLTTSHFYYQP